MRSMATNRKMREDWILHIVHTAMYQRRGKTGNQAAWVHFHNKGNHDASEGEGIGLVVMACFPPNTSSEAMT